MDPYARALFKENPFSLKRSIECSAVAVLQARLDNRSLRLIPQISRVLKKNDIHELIFTDEKESRPETIVNRIAYIAFIEILKGGVMVVGDKVYWNNNLLGIVAGFDDTHMPNHQNIILYSPKISTGKELGIQVEDPVVISSQN
ncbi:MAG: hypothetical protein RBS20_02300 [Atribacterota bacterium]|jgi:hypothetical protein|nr:hypothetical protein [Atribacterota bacterium]